jgi:predicted secreted protein
MDSKKIIRYVLIAAVVLAFFYGSYYALTHMGDASMGDGHH